jgi:poly(A) polymerase
MEAAMLPATLQFDAAVRIVAELRAAGYEAYLAGGCVRDLLLGRAPKDYDVATSATPDVVLNLFPRTFAVGAHFGVVLVATCGGANSAHAGTCGGADAACAAGAELAAPQGIFPAATKSMRADSEQLAPPQVPQVLTEVATFRSDGAYSDGRHPDAVRYTTSAEEDVRRRDFTINGLLFDPLRIQGSLIGPHDKAFAVREGLIDHVGGLADLDAGVVRAIGRADLRFEEDRLRMLRGVRFAARFGFELEAATEAATRRLAPQIAAVSRERVRDELTKMLTEGAARRAFELLEATGLLGEALPEVARMKGVEQPPQFHPEGDVWVHTLLLLGQLEAGCPLTLAWGALLHDVGKPATFTRADRIRFNGHVEVGVAISAEICRRFRFSNDETRLTLALVENHMRFGDAQRMKSSTLKRFFRLEEFDQHLALHRMDCMAARGNLEHWEFVRERYAAIPAEAVRPRLLVTGRDLIAAGYRPGAEFKQMLRAAEDAQLEGQIETVEEAIKLIRERFPVL